MEGTSTFKYIAWLWIWGILTYCWLNQEAIMIYWILLVVDFIFGVAEVYLTDKTQVRSDSAIKWLIKKMTRFCMPFVVAIVMKWAGFDDMDTFITVIMWILIVSEWYSIIGHIYNINTGKTLPEINGFESVINMIVSIFKKKIEPQQ